MWTLVTGGAKNLGKELCIALAENGHSIVVHYRHSIHEALEVVEKCRSLQCHAEAIQGDFSSIEGVKDFLERYQKRFQETSLLINNVGEYLIGSALQTSLEEWISLFQVNLNTPFMLMQGLIPSIIKCKGQIINIGYSGLHRHVANTYASAFHLTKQGLWGLTLSLARELAPKGVRVNMVSPGELNTSIDHHKIPMLRQGTLREVCRVVKFLIDPESEYITGQNIDVSGGLGLA